ncbi:hypothetical protein [Sphingobium sp.]|uniref:hypothetical protein n=1 Tax=Sphingobium sp. TaxID=1912891 RepID=UPI002CFF1E0B|nr:hypothetical protein [Sphingobium sp.]HUD90080.1 hypothetical protein [Sphingobium sp.]
MMVTVEVLRATTEDDVAQALIDVGAALPVAEVATLSIVMGRLRGRVVDMVDLDIAFHRSALKFPINTLAGLVEAVNCYLDYEQSRTTTGGA